MDYLGLIAIILWVLTIVGFIIRNLYVKNIKLENRVIELENYQQTMLLLSLEFSKLVEVIDSKIWIQNDPEFINLISKAKEISEILRNYDRVSE